jgi:hypothetical protein
MEEDQQDPAPRRARSRLWLAVAVAFVAAAVWAGMALAAARSSSKPASSPAAPAQMSGGYAASNSAQGDCPNMGNDNSGSATTPGV